MCTFRWLSTSSFTWAKNGAARRTLSDNSTISTRVPAYWLTAPAVTPPPRPTTSTSARRGVEHHRHVADHAVRVDHAGGVVRLVQAVQEQDAFGATLVHAHGGLHPLVAPEFPVIGAMATRDRRHERIRDGPCGRDEEGGADGHLPREAAAIGMGGEQDERAGEVEGREHEQRSCGCPARAGAGSRPSRRRQSRPRRSACTAVRRDARRHQYRRCVFGRPVGRGVARWEMPCP